MLWRKIKWDGDRVCSGEERASQVVLRVKNLPASAGRHKRHSFDPWVRKIPGGGPGKSVQYSCLDNPMDREAWRAMVHKNCWVGHDRRNLKRRNLNKMVREGVSGDGAMLLHEAGHTWQGKQVQRPWGRLVPGGFGDQLTGDYGWKGQVGTWQEMKSEGDWWTTSRRAT